MGHHLADELKDKKKKNKSIVLKIPCEVYSRVVGYMRPVDNWNKGKQQEFKERKMFKIPENLDGK